MRQSQETTASTHKGNSDIYVKAQLDQTSESWILAIAFLQTTNMRRSSIADLPYSMYLPGC